MASLISRYQFENGYTDTQGVNDLSAQGSGNTFDGTIKKERNFSLSLNGSGGAAKTAGVTGLPTGNNDASWGGWIYFSTFVGNPYFATWGTNSSAQSWQWYIIDASTVRFTLNALENKDFTVTTMSTSGFYWYWVEYTASSKTLQLYQDNVSQGTSTALTNTPNIVNSYIHIGQSEGAGQRTSQHFDDWRFYSGVTTSGDRSAIFTDLASAGGSFLNSFV